MVQNGYDSLPKPVDKFSGRVVYRGVHDSNGKTADQYINDMKYKPMMISGGNSSSKGRGYYFSELEFMAGKHARPNGKITKWGIAQGSAVLDLENAKRIIKQVNNLPEDSHLMDSNCDIVGILSGHDIIGARATVNVLNGGVIEWLRNTK